MPSLRLARVQRIGVGHRPVRNRKQPFAVGREPFLAGVPFPRARARPYLLALGTRKNLLEQADPAPLGQHVVKQPDRHFVEAQVERLVHALSRVDPDERQDVFAAVPGRAYILNVLDAFRNSRRGCLLALLGRNLRSKAPPDQRLGGGRSRLVEAAARGRPLVGRLGQLREKLPARPLLGRREGGDLLLELSDHVGDLFVRGILGERPYGLAQATNRHLESRRLVERVVVDVELTPIRQRPVRVLDIVQAAEAVLPTRGPGFSQLSSQFGSAIGVIHQIIDRGELGAHLTLTLEFRDVLWP